MRVELLLLCSRCITRTSLFSGPSQQLSLMTIAPRQCKAGRSGIRLASYCSCPNAHLECLSCAHKSNKPDECMLWARCPKSQLFIGGWKRLDEADGREASALLRIGTFVSFGDAESNHRLRRLALKQASWRGSSRLSHERLCLIQ